jgi:parallel beta helix pectate lyase-like protein
MQLSDKSDSRSKALIAIAVILGLLGIFLLLAVAQRRRDSSATRERRVGNSSTIQVRSGGNLQAAIDGANYGDVIILEAGATYKGIITLPFKEGDSDQYITITTSNLSGIAKENERINPQIHAKAMPKIVAPDSGVAIATAERAHHYKFIGIEFSPAADSKYLYNLIDLGKTDYKSLSQFPHHLVFDRCYIRSTGLNKARRGIGLNSGDTTIINSYIAGFAGAGDETQGICGWNGPGPYKIVNNYIEGGAQNIMFGGADPAVPNLVPADIEIRRNYLYKPPEWFGKATIKAMIELKNGRKVTIDGNVLESGGLIGAFVLTVRNQSGTAPWSTLEDIIITNNVVRHSNTGFSILGKDDAKPSQQAKRIRIANNLLVDIVPDYAAVFMVGCCANTLTVENNTVQQTGNIMTCYGVSNSNFVFRNNIIQFNSFGFACPVNMLSPDSRGNIIVDNKSQISANGYPANIPRGNYVVNSLDQVGFVDFSSGDWRLGPQSKVKGKGSDGKNPGVDFDALGAAVAPSDVEAPFFGKSRQ